MMMKCLPGLPRRGSGDEKTGGDNSMPLRF